MSLPKHAMRSPLPRCRSHQRHRRFPEAVPRALCVDIPEFRDAKPRSSLRLDFVEYRRPADSIRERESDRQVSVRDACLTPKLISSKMPKNARTCQPEVASRAAAAAEESAFPRFPRQQQITRHPPRRALGMKARRDSSADGSGMARWFSPQFLVTASGLRDNVTRYARPGKIRLNAVCRGRCRVSRGKPIAGAHLAQD